ncbi:hypothetical protein ACH4KO_17900 [Streptomyces anulatus]
MVRGLPALQVLGGAGPGLGRPTGATGGSGDVMAGGRTDGTTGGTFGGLDL